MPDPNNILDYNEDVDTDYEDEDDEYEEEY
jgi:hypothetical protein